MGITVSLDVSYQDRRETSDSTPMQRKLENDGHASSARICERMLVADIESAARMGNALAAGYRQQFKTNHPNRPWTEVSIVIRDADTGEWLVRAWEGATQYRDQ